MMTNRECNRCGLQRYLANLNPGRTAHKPKVKPVKPALSDKIGVTTRPKATVTQADVHVDTSDKQRAKPVATQPASPPALSPYDTDAPIDSGIAYPFPVRLLANLKAAPTGTSTETFTCEPLVVHASP